jgi:Protein of unknown function (DUF3631)
MKLPHKRVCISIRKLHERYVRAENEHIKETARQKLEARLAKYGLKWEDLDAVLKKADQADPHPHDILILLISLTHKYLWMTPEERIAYSLWALHTYVYRRYNKTPRLAFLSPVAGCGKTEAMKLLEQIVNRPSPVYVNVSPALVYRLLDDVIPPTLLLDEGDNLGIFQDRVLRSVLNANRQGSPVGRAVGSSGTRAYDTFAPIAIAAIGRLTNTLTQRSIIINMQRYPANAPPLERLNEKDPQFLMEMGVIREEIRKWVNTCELEQNPETPVVNRYADNWRPLIAIADSLGRGDEAREAAIAMCAGLPDDDPKVDLLMDIRDVFDGPPSIDRIFSKDLLEKLHEIESGMWQEWRGPQGDLQPHPLTARELARTLVDFKIKPRTVHPLGSRDTRGPSAMGYFRKDFESAWASYCTSRAGHPPTHQPTMKLINGGKDD